MHDYELHHADSSQHSGPMLQFKAEDPCMAILIAQKRAPSSRVELWENGEPVCELTRAKVGDGEIWIVGQDD
jgi:hypothetical protein